MLSSRIISPFCRQIHSHLVPSQVDSLLRRFEKNFDEKNDAINFNLQMNQIASNSPIEDAMTFMKYTTETNKKIFMVGVFDGHGGYECARTASHRLGDYIAPILFEKKQLESLLSSLDQNLPVFDNLLKPTITSSKDDVVNLEKNEIEQFLNENLKANHEIFPILPRLQHESHDLLNESQFINQRFTLHHVTALRNWIFKMLSIYPDKMDHAEIQNLIQLAFVQFDNDILLETTNGLQSFKISFSGACANVALFQQDSCGNFNVYVANSGDCHSMLGFTNIEKKPLSYDMSHEHNTGNLQEVERILAQHDASENVEILSNNRLLGCLAPLRAFGDAMYKFNLNQAQNVIDKLDHSNILPENIKAPNLILHNSKTPPYLTAQPQTTHEKISSNAFLIMATDGIWECLNKNTVMDILNTHLCTKVVRSSKYHPQNDDSLLSIDTKLSSRKQFNMKFRDDNSATHLFRKCLGYDHFNVSKILSIQHGKRDYMDDMSAVIVNFLKI